MKYHPDQHQGSEKSVEKFREITEAYQVLINVHKRKLYDKGFHYSSVAASPAQREQSKNFYGSKLVSFI